MSRNLGNGHMYEIDNPLGTPIDFPWSRELEKEMEERLGENYGQMLGLLWETEANPLVTARVRYAYMDAVTKLVRVKIFPCRLETGAVCMG